MRTILITFLLGQLIFSTSFTDAHKYYMSVTEIDYKEKSQSLEMSIQIFTDDFEIALEKRSKEKIRLGTEREHKETDTYIKEYLEENIDILTDEKTCTINYIGKEDKLAKTYCYVEIKNVAPFKKITITNSILFSLYDKQKNIIHFRRNRKKRSLFLYSGKASGSFIF